MSCSVSHKTSERKVEFDVEKSDIEKEIELVDMKANSSKVWTQIALRRKMKYDLLNEVMFRNIVKQWELAKTHDQLKCMNQYYMIMQTFEKILKSWTNTFEERKENWLKNVGDLAIKKAIASTNWNKF
jgi:hypothetical protein